MKPALAHHGIANTLDRHDEAMRRYAFRMVGCAEGMDDVLWDAYFSAGLERGDIDRLGERVWLYRLVHRSCRDHAADGSARTQPAETILALLQELPINERGINSRLGQLAIGKIA